MPTCGFCQGKPVGNAARWSGDTTGPDFLPCPRCGKTWQPPERPTHYHSIVALPSVGDADDGEGRFPIVEHEVTCVYENDPTSDDAIVTSKIWLDPGQVDGDPFPCPICGDDISTKATREENQ
jgi:hypothetical protein